MRAGGGAWLGSVRCVTAALSPRYNGEIGDIVVGRITEVKPGVCRGAEEEEEESGRGSVRPKAFPRLLKH